LRHFLSFSSRKLLASRRVGPAMLREPTTPQDGFAQSPAGGEEAATKSKAEEKKARRGRARAREANTAGRSRAGHQGRKDSRGESDNATAARRKRNERRRGGPASQGKRGEREEESLFRG